MRVELGTKRVFVVGDAGRVELGRAEGVFLLLLLRAARRRAHDSGELHWAEARPHVRTTRAGLRGDFQVCARLVDSLNNQLADAVAQGAVTQVAFSPGGKCAGPWRIAPPIPHVVIAVASSGESVETDIDVAIARWLGPSTYGASPQTDHLQASNARDACIEIVMADHYHRSGSSEMAAEAIRKAQRLALTSADRMLCLAHELEVARRQEDFTTHRNLLAELSAACAAASSDSSWVLGQAKCMVTLHSAIYRYSYLRDCYGAHRILDHIPAGVDHLIVREVSSLRSHLFRRQLSDAIPVSWDAMSDTARNQWAIANNLYGLAHEALVHASTAVDAALLLRSEYHAMNALLNFGYLRAWLACRKLSGTGPVPAVEQVQARSVGLRSMVDAIALGALTDRGGDDWWKPIMFVEIANRAEFRAQDVIEGSGLPRVAYADLERWVEQGARSGRFASAIREGLSEYLFKNTFGTLDARESDGPEFARVPLVQAHNAYCTLLIRGALDGDTSRFPEASETMVRCWLPAVRTFAADAVGAAASDAAFISCKLGTLLEGLNSARRRTEELVRANRGSLTFLKELDHLIQVLQTVFAQSKVQLAALRSGKSGNQR